MQRVPFDQFLEDLALYGADPSERAVKRDVAAFWADLPSSTREAYLDELGFEDADTAAVVPRLEGSEILFDLPSAEPDAGGAVDAAAALASLASGVDVDALDAAAVEEADHATAEPDAVEALDPSLGEPLEPSELAAMEEATPADALYDEDALDDADLLDDDLIDAELLDDDLLEAELEDADLDDIELADAELEDADLDEAAAEEADVEDGESSGYEPPKNTREVEVYPVAEPYAYVRISYDLDHHQYLYEVIEPELTEREAKVLQFIEETIVDVLDIGLSTLTKEEGEQMIMDLTDQVIGDYSIEVDEKSRMKLIYYTVRDFLGFGKLDAIMRDALIEDISCDGADIPIFLYHRKYESVASTVVYRTDQELDSFVIKLAQRSGKHISIADPLLDARLPDGSRLNATLSREVTASGSTFTIRKFKPEPFTPPDLIRFGTQSPEMQAYLWMAIQHGASLILAGGTASGKTTALNAMLLFIPPQMKIVSIEDTRELNLPHPNWIPGTTRAGFGPRDDHGHQAGEIDMFQLLKAALRQRPEYIAVGEVRGEEATVLFQAMATGHAAYGTMHADSVTSVIHRLEGKPISIPRPLLEALDIVCIQIQTRIGGKRVRRTKELVEIVGLDPNTKELLTNEVFRWDPSTDVFHPSGISYVLERIQRENNLSRRELQAEMENRTQIIEWLVEKGVRDYVEVAKIVQSYYNEGEATMKRVKHELELLREGVAPEDLPPFEVSSGPGPLDDLPEPDEETIDPFLDLPTPGEDMDDADLLDDADLDDPLTEDPSLLDDLEGVDEASAEDDALRAPDLLDDLDIEPVEETPGLSRVPVADDAEDVAADDDEDTQHEE